MRGLYFTRVKSGWRAHYGSYYATSSTKERAVQNMVVAFKGEGMVRLANTVKAEWQRLK